MSDKVKGFTVSLEDDLHEDDAKKISDAINLLAGVASVDNIVIDGCSDYITKQRIKHELFQALIDFIQEWK